MTKAQRKHRRKIAILGGGSWGTALGVVFSERHEVLIWEFDAAQAKQVEKERRNTIFLPKIKLPDNMHITNDMALCIANADVVVFAVPSHVLRQTAVQAALYTTKKQYLVSVVKGVEQNTLMRMSEVIQECIPESKGVIALLGPTHAEEVANGLPSTIVASCVDHKHATAIQKLFITPRFRIYTNTDMIGSEISSALKNVIAIAAGICDGLNYGDNTKAAVITRGLAEIKRLGLKMGADPVTFSGLTGMGDLIVTCMSRHSRNRKVGMMLGRGRSLEDILESMQQVAEGVKNTKSALSLAKKYKVELPVAAAVHQILFDKLKPRDISGLLMTRSPKSEFY